MLLQRTIPNVLALSEHHTNILSLQYVILLCLRRPAFKTEHLEEFNLRPEMWLKLSKTSTRVVNEVSVPSVIKVASSAKSTFFISWPLTHIPLIDAHVLMDIS